MKRVLDLKPVAEGLNDHMLQRFLDPDVLAVISGLELIAKTVVEGFVVGTSSFAAISDSVRSSPNTAPTREGDDLRHVDWNVFARTERMYLEALSRRNQHASHDPAGCERVHGLRLAQSQ